LGQANTQQRHVGLFRLAAYYGRAGHPLLRCAQYHIWTWHYKRDNTYAMYVDRRKVQSGSDHFWNYGNRAGEKTISLNFLFGAAWGHT
jgi:hypothetical protein